VSNRVPDLRPVITAKHPFESCFVDLGNHSADKALIALTDAVHAEQREMNAYDWITQALPNPPKLRNGDLSARFLRHGFVGFRAGFALL
jgi:hypothetical protein